MHYKISTSLLVILSLICEVQFWRVASHQLQYSFLTTAKIFSSPIFKTDLETDLSLRNRSFLWAMCYSNFKHVWRQIPSVQPIQNLGSLYHALAFHTPPPPPSLLWVPLAQQSPVQLLQLAIHSMQQFSPEQRINFKKRYSLCISWQVNRILELQASFETTKLVTLFCFCPRRNEKDTWSSCIYVSHESPLEAHIHSCIVHYWSTSPWQGAFGLHSSNDFKTSDFRLHLHLWCIPTAWKQTQLRKVSYEVRLLLLAFTISKPSKGHLEISPVLRCSWVTLSFWFFRSFDKFY